MIKIGAKNQSDKIIFEDSGSATLLAQLIPSLGHYTVYKTVRLTPVIDELTLASMRL
jgi:hypothetical protein